MQLSHVKSNDINVEKIITQQLKTSTDPSGWPQMNCEDTKETQRGKRLGQAVVHDFGVVGFSW